MKILGVKVGQVINAIDVKNQFRIYSSDVTKICQIEQQKLKTT